MPEQDSFLTFLPLNYISFHGNEEKGRKETIKDSSVRAYTVLKSFFKSGLN